jgi:hypothetical protein
MQILNQAMALSIVINLGDIYHGIRWIEKIRANGTAIEGVCVTGEAIRPVVPVVSNGRVPVASRYGAIFACPTGVSRAGNHGELKELK